MAVKLQHGYGIAKPKVDFGWDRWAYGTLANAANEPSSMMI
jgi:hypothetical protein